MFGWKVSWVWYYTGIMAIFMQFAVYDPLIAIAHWIMIKKCKKAGRKLQKCRSMGQGFNETYDLSEGELEERRLQEEQEKAKKLAEKKAKGKKKNKKAKKGGNLFGEAENTQGNDMFGESPGDKVEQFGIDDGP